MVSRNQLHYYNTSFQNVNNFFKKFRFIFSGRHCRPEFVHRPQILLHCAAQLVEHFDIVLPVDHEGIVEHQHIVNLLLPGEGNQVQGGLAVGVELSGINDDDLAVVAGQERNERIAVGVLQDQAGGHIAELVDMHQKIQ